MEALPRVKPDGFRPVRTPSRKIPKTPPISKVNFTDKTCRYTMFRCLLKISFLTLIYNATQALCLAAEVKTSARA